METLNCFVSVSSLLLVSAFMCACVRTCIRVCVRACVRLCVCVVSTDIRQHLKKKKLKERFSGGLKKRKKKWEAGILSPGVVAVVDRFYIILF